MKEVGLVAALIETSHVRDAFKAMPVKTDRKDQPAVVKSHRRDGGSGQAAE